MVSKRFRLMARVRTLVTRVIVTALAPLKSRVQIAPKALLDLALEDAGTSFHFLARREGCVEYVGEGATGEDRGYDQAEYVEVAEVLVVQ